MRLTSTTGLVSVQNHTKIERLVLSIKTMPKIKLPNFALQLILLKLKLMRDPFARAFFGAFGFYHITVTSLWSACVMPGRPPSHT